MTGYWLRIVITFQPFIGRQATEILLKMSHRAELIFTKILKFAVVNIES